MTSGCLGHTSARAKTFFYNANLLGFRPAPTAPGIGDREDLNFGSVSMLGHSVGFNRKTSDQKDGPRRMNTLQVARTALVKERTRLRNRSHVQVNPVLKRQIKARLALVERQLAEIDTEIARLIASDEALQRKREILCSIPGLGPIAAALILTFLPEMGSAPAQCRIGR